MRKLALHWQILLGMVIGVLAGYIAVLLNGDQFIQDWIDPFEQVDEYHPKWVNPVLDELVSVEALHRVGPYEP